MLSGPSGRQDDAVRVVNGEIRRRNERWTNDRFGSPSDLPSLAQNVSCWGQSGLQIQATGLPSLAGS